MSRFVAKTIVFLYAFLLVNPASGAAKEMTFSDDFSSYRIYTAYRGEYLDDKGNWESNDTHTGKGWVVAVEGKDRYARFWPSPWPGGYSFDSNHLTYHVHTDERISSTVLDIDYALQKQGDVKVFISPDNNNWAEITESLGFVKSNQPGQKNVRADISERVSYSGVNKDLYVRFRAAAYSSNNWVFSLHRFAVKVKTGPGLKVVSKKEVAPEEETAVLKEKTASLEEETVAQKEESLALEEDSFPFTPRGVKVTVRIEQGVPIRLYEGSYALVIGNAEYTRGWDPIPGAVSDAREVAEALERNGFKVTLHTNLSKNEFDKVFRTFCKKYGSDKENRLLFYYAGHGYTEKLATGEDLGYLVMTDAPVPESDPVGFDLASVDMVSIVTQAKKIHARHVLFVFDSCFSGSILNLRDRVTPEAISENIRYPVRQFITSGRADEPVPDYSVFKQAFLDLIEGRDKEPIPDGYITGEELGLYLKNKVPEYNSSQHPQYGKIRDPSLDKGDFVFVPTGKE